jgi:hypothetical protein
MLIPATSVGSVVLIVVVCIAVIPLLVWRLNHHPVPIWKRFSRHKGSRNDAP